MVTYISKQLCCWCTTVHYIKFAVSVSCQIVPLPLAILQDSEISEIRLFFYLVN